MTAKDLKFTAASTALGIAVPFAVTGYLKSGIASFAVAIVFLVAWLLDDEPSSSPWQSIKAEWEVLSQQDIAETHRLRDAGAIVRADHHQPPHKGWELGGYKSAIKRDVELLSQRCGALLTRRLRKTLNSQTLAADNDLDRWLYFLKEVGEDVPAHLRMISSGSINGVPTPTLYHEAIESVTKASVRACTECLRRERA